MQARIEKLRRELEGIDGAEMRHRLARIAPNLTLSERFDLLHALGVYRGRDSASGEASDTVATGPLRKALPELVKSLGVRLLLDAPCGDCHWMSMIGFAGAEAYLGIDIVGAVVAQNRQRYGGGRRNFRVGDITRDDLPKADLVLCRDALIHLGNEDALAALRMFVRSGSRWLLTTTFDASRGNVDIESGSFRPVALEAAPFFLPEPELRIAEADPSAEGLFPDRSIALWSLTSVAKALTSRP